MYCTLQIITGLLAGTDILWDGQTVTYVMLSLYPVILTFEVE